MLDDLSSTRPRHRPSRKKDVVQQSTYSPFTAARFRIIYFTYKSCISCNRLFRLFILLIRVVLRIRWFVNHTHTYIYIHIQLFLFWRSLHDNGFIWPLFREGKSLKLGTDVVCGSPTSGLLTNTCSNNDSSDPTDIIHQINPPFRRIGAVRILLS